MLGSVGDGQGGSQDTNSPGAWDLSGRGDTKQTATIQSAVQAQARERFA